MSVIQQQATFSGLNYMYIEDWLGHYPDRTTLLDYKSFLFRKLGLVHVKLNTKKSKLEIIKDIQFICGWLHLEQERAFLPEIKLLEVVGSSFRMSG